MATTAQENTKTSLCQFCFFLASGVSVLSAAGLCSSFKGAYLGFNKRKLIRLVKETMQFARFSTDELQQQPKLKGQRVARFPESIAFWNGL